MRRRPLLAGLLALATGCLGRTTGSPGSTPATTDPGGSTREPAATSTGTAATPTAPLVQWGFSWDEAAGAVTITHRGGDTLTRENTDRLEVVVTTHPDHHIPEDATLTPTRTPRTWRTTWREAADGEPYPIRRGDEATISGVTPGDTVAIRWFGIGGNPSGTRLESHTLPKED